MKDGVKRLLKQERIHKASLFGDSFTLPHKSCPNLSIHNSRNRSGHKLEIIFTNVTSTKTKCTVHIFPFKFTHCTERDRSFVGNYWTIRVLRHSGVLNLRICFFFHTWGAKILTVHCVSATKDLVDGYVLENCDNYYLGRTEFAYTCPLFHATLRKSNEDALTYSMML